MSRYISENLRKEVEVRANGKCEYCKIAIEDTYFGGKVDHIISFKHRGQTISSNLALACQPCNRNKGSDLGSITVVSGLLVRFYNPRTDIWDNHFQVNSKAEIISQTEIGEVTAFVFGFNEPERISERLGLIEIGHYQI